MTRRQPASLLPSAAARAHMERCASCRELARRLARAWALLRRLPGGMPPYGHIQLGR